MTITNLMIFYLISIIVVATMPSIIGCVKELKQWKNAYDKQKRIEKFIEEFDDSMNNIENNNDIDEYIRKAILYD